jgi:WD40-like Beta Propeller Repeat
MPVRRLRDVLGDSADAPRYIETLPRRGYRFIGNLSDGSTAAPLVPEAAPTQPGPTEIGTSGVTLRQLEPTRRPRWRWLLALASLVLAGGLGVWAGRRFVAPAREPPRPRPLTSLPGLELDPAISPAGNAVAFAGDGEHGDNFDIYVRSLEGGLPLRLTTDGAADHAPAWSPDGQRIAFVRLGAGRRTIVVVQPSEGPSAGCWTQVRRTAAGSSAPSRMASLGRRMAAP